MSTTKKGWLARRKDKQDRMDALLREAERARDDKARRSDFERWNDPALNTDIRTLARLIGMDADGNGWMSDGVREWAKRYAEMRANDGAKVLVEFTPRAISDAYRALDAIREARTEG